MAYESYPVEASSWFNPGGILPNRRKRALIPISSNIITKFFSVILKFILNSSKPEFSVVSLSCLDELDITVGTGILFQAADQEIELAPYMTVVQ